MQIDIFEKQKTDVLSRIDKSRIGGIDKDILPVVNLINSHPDYYTSSSCSGRIMLIQLPENGKKDESSWIYVTHDKVDHDKLTQSLKGCKGNIWFRQESYILHICCRNLESAEKMLQLLQESGSKRTGIVTLSNRIMIESFGTDRMDSPVAADGKMIVDEKFIDYLIKEANRKLEKNFEKINKLNRALSAFLKAAQVSPQ